MMVSKLHIGKNMIYCFTDNYHPQDQLIYCASKMAKNHLPFVRAIQSLWNTLIDEGMWCNKAQYQTLGRAEVTLPDLLIKLILPTHSCIHSQIPRQVRQIHLFKTCVCHRRQEISAGTSPLCLTTSYEFLWFSKTVLL